MQVMTYRDEGAKGLTVSDCNETDIRPPMSEEEVGQVPPFSRKELAVQIKQHPLSPAQAVSTN